MTLGNAVDFAFYRAGIGVDINCSMACELGHRSDPVVATLSTKKWPADAGSTERPVKVQSMSNHMVVPMARH
jgi:hypothetical protein